MSPKDKNSQRRLVLLPSKLESSRSPFLYLCSLLPRNHKKQSSRRMKGIISLHLLIKIEALREVVCTPPPSRIREDSELN